MKKILLVLFVLISLSACKDTTKEDPAPITPVTPITPPVSLSFESVSGILDNSIVVKGKAVNTGDNVKEYGFVYSKNAEFDINTGVKVSLGTKAPEVYSGRIEGFEQNTAYNGKFYLIKKDDQVVYSAVRQFKTVAQGTWVSLALMHADHDFSSVFVIEDLIYLVPSYIAPNDRKLYVYDLKSDEWRIKGDLPFSSRYNSNAFSYNGKGYVMLGRSADTYFDEVWEYNPVENKWTQKASCPAKMGRASGFLIDGKYYVTQGADNTPRYYDYSTYEYNIESDTWTKKNAVYDEFSVIGFGNSFVYNGIGYIFNSDDRYILDEQFAAYDPKSDSWSYTRSPVPGHTTPKNVTSGKAESVVIKDKVYTSVTSGSVAGVGQDMYTYDMKTLTWEKIGTFPVYSSIGNGAVLTNYKDRIFLSSRRATYLYIPVE